MSHVLRMVQTPEFAEVLKAVCRAFDKDPKEAERTQTDYFSKFFSSLDPNLVVPYANIKNNTIDIEYNDKSIEVYVDLSKDEPSVDVHYNGRIVKDRDGLIGAFREAGYDVYEVLTSGRAKFMKGKKTQNGKTNLVDIQMGGQRTVFSAGEHVDIADFELLEKFLVDYEPESLA